MKYLMILACAAVPLVGVQAQERTAGSTLDTQMTWSALSSKIGGVDTKVDGVNSLVQQSIICGRKGMIHAPGGSPVDSQGCKDPKDTTNLSTVNNSLTTTNTNLTNLANTVNSLNTQVTQMMNCNDNGQLFDRSASKCVAPSGGFDLGNYTISDADSGAFRRNTTYTAKADTLVMGSKSGSGNSTCHSYAYVNGNVLLYNYGRFSSVTFIARKGDTWRIDMREDSNCRGPGTISILPLN
jgi:hypothetical protein